jgi:hypothetical protein
VAYEADLYDMIQEDIDNDERTLQIEMGPSGLGTPCYHCLGAGLALEPKVEDPEARWLSYIGKCVHTGLQKAAERQNAKYTAQGLETRWLTEQRVVVGDVGPRSVEGNSDVYDMLKDVVVDWKVVGNKTLEYVRRYGASEVYKRQIQLYGRGFEELGLQPKKVCIVFLPREKFKMRDGFVYFEDYDPRSAEETLKRANDIWDLGMKHGWDYVLPRLKREKGCRDCTKYAR